MNRRSFLVDSLTSFSATKPPPVFEASPGTVLDVNFVTQRQHFDCLYKLEAVRTHLEFDNVTGNSSGFTLESLPLRMDDQGLVSSILTERGSPTKRVPISPERDLGLDMINDFDAAFDA
ncbi:hypothetical protein QEH53_00700 [Pelagicoccus sp. SDUM812002]|nr:hypothetical protein [Pelagicoccus sp. SDUM812002]MDQ8184079.1 hypothetical protein [Pelagicoccus sp. SDUM812002]